MKPTIYKQTFELDGDSYDAIWEIMPDTFDDPGYIELIDVLGMSEWYTREELFKEADKAYSFCQLEKYESDYYGDIDE